MVDKNTNLGYTFVEVNETNGIKIESGEYSGVIVRIDSADVKEDGEHAVLSFDYDVIYDAEKTPEELTSVEFKNTIGDILINIIVNSDTVKNIESEQIDTEEPEL